MKLPANTSVTHSPCRDGKQMSDWWGRRKLSTELKLPGLQKLSPNQLLHCLCQLWPAVTTRRIFCISGGGSCQEDALIPPKWWSALNTDALAPLSWAWATVHLPPSPFSLTPALQHGFPLSVLRKSQIGLFTRATHCYPPGLVKLQRWVVCQATKELEYIVSLYLDSL